jgi:hypothetical protein
MGTAVCTIAAPVVAISRVNDTARPMEMLASRASIDMACPQCGHRRMVPTGNARCPDCRTCLFIEIGEPRCECGRAIPPEMRWRETSAAADDTAAAE